MVDREACTLRPSGSGNRRDPSHWDVSGSAVAASIPSFITESAFKFLNQGPSRAPVQLVPRQAELHLRCPERVAAVAPTVLATLAHVGCPLSRAAQNNGTFWRPHHTALQAHALSAWRFEVPAIHMRIRQRMRLGANRN